MPIAPAPVIPANAGLILPKRQPKPKRKRSIADKFSERELRFVELILQGVDKVDAFKSAGYDAANIPQQSWKMLHKPKIVRLLSLRREQDARANAIDAPYVIETIKAEIEYLKSDPDRSAAASQAIFRGTELLGKTIALFRDRVEEDRQITVTIERIGG